MIQLLIRHYQNIYNMSSCNTNKKKSTSCSVTDEGCKTSTSTAYLGEYWCAMYTDVDITKLGWYEEESSPSLELIKKTKLPKEAIQFHVGAGSTTLIDSLVDEGYANLIVNDISSCALNKIKSRIGERQDKVQWVVDDLVNPTVLENLPKVDLWNDRAVLHFFTKEKDQDTYFKLLNEKVKEKGFVILSVFNLDGATKCSGLDVKRYNATMLQEKLGKAYQMLESFNHSYTMPNGEDRPYVYALFQRIA